MEYMTGIHDEFDRLEKEMATHSSILAWEIIWRGEPCGNHKSRMELVTKPYTFSSSFMSSLTLLGVLMNEWRHSSLLLFFSFMPCVFDHLLFPSLCWSCPFDFAYCLLFPLSHKCIDYSDLNFLLYSFNTCFISEFGFDDCFASWQYVFSLYMYVYIYGNRHTFPPARPSVGVWMEVGLDLRLAVIMIKPNTPFDSYNGNFCLEWGLIYHIISVQPLIVAIPQKEALCMMLFPEDWTGGSCSEA